MNSEIQAVREFHEKVKVSTPQRLTDLFDIEVDNLIQGLSNQLLASSRSLEPMLKVFSHDRRVLRAHLMIEELGELLEAMANRNEVGALDALTDLTYVVFGTAVTLDLPLDEAFQEVHRSNMTKQKMSNDPGKERIRDKGPNYVPADLDAILRRHR